METITSKEMFAEKKQEGRTIFVFSADWCKDCVFIKPHLPEIVSEFPDYTFYLVDRDDMLELCQDLNIFGIPSFLAYHNGEEVGRFVSKDRKTKEEVIKFIQELN